MFKQEYTDKEIWIPIVGFETMCEVSNYGRVKSIRRKCITKRGYGISVGGMIMSLKTNKQTGYLSFTPSIAGYKFHFTVHTVVAKHFVSKVLGNDVVNHKDGNKLNNHHSNLEWTTHKGNINHAYQTGLNKKILGINNHRTKLTDEQVLEIYNSTGLHRDIAKKFNVHRVTVGEIKRGKKRSTITLQTYTPRQYCSV